MAEVSLQGNKILPFEHLTAKVIVNLKGNGKNETELANSVVTIENSVLSGNISVAPVCFPRGKQGDYSEKSDLIRRVCLFLSCVVDSPGYERKEVH